MLEPVGLDRDFGVRILLFWVPYYAPYAYDHGRLYCCTHGLDLRHGEDDVDPVVTWARPDGYAYTSFVCSWRCGISGPTSLPPHCLESWTPAPTAPLIVEVGSAKHWGSKKEIVGGGPGYCAGY